MNKSDVRQQKTFFKNVVKRGNGRFFRQVIERKKKIILEKCPSCRMQYDIMVL